MRHRILFLLLCAVTTLQAGNATDSLILRQETLIQEVIAGIQIDSLLMRVRILSGEQEVRIGGANYTILSRYRSQPGNTLAAQYLYEELTRYGLHPFYDYFGAQGANVVAFQEGYLHPEQQFMICAHYDCMPAGNRSYGADDNASGTAAVLEAARLLGRRPMPFTVAYALWDEEEAGLLGSRAYAEKVARIGQQILGVINMDMIAYDGNADGIVTLHVRPVARSLDLCQRLIDINTNYAIGLDPWAVNPGTPKSDHASFWEKNYSAVLVIEDYRRGTAVDDFNPWYHSLDDRIMLNGQYLFDLGYFLRCAQMSLGALASYLFDVAPAAPVPQPAALVRPVRTAVTWAPSGRARAYRLQLARDPKFQTIDLDYPAVTDTSWVPARLRYDTDYFWRVRGYNRGGSGDWSAAANFTTSGPQQRTLALHPGWNLVTSSIAPDDSSLDHLLPKSGLLLRDGQGRRFAPDYGWDERKNWSVLEGFWIHADDSAELQFSGWEINTAPTPLPLRAGWQILPYWHTTSLPVAAVFSRLAGRGAVIKDAVGRVWWPAEGILEIADLEPDQAYQLHLDAADTLALPVNDQAIAISPADPSSLRPATLHYRPRSGTGVTAHLLLDTADLERGDEVGVWADGTLLIGGGRVEGPKTLLTLWGDDIATGGTIDGARSGSILNLTLWNEAMALERVLNLEQVREVWSNNAAVLPLSYEADGFWRGRAGAVEAIPKRLTLYQNYPNPFNSTTLLRYVLPHGSRVLLRIFNLQGQEVSRLAEGEQRAGIYERSFRAEGLASGIYWVELRAGAEVHRISMMLLR
ncbi:MAG TPA: M28 family peptidase [bacterium]|nr:M28 family peptidase [bacterium]HQI49583.1 M28 family peptidase [bacterium]HQJ65936.1 M28 family peptidase [bacterium]